VTVSLEHVEQGRRRAVIRGLLLALVTFAVLVVVAADQPIGSAEQTVRAQPNGSRELDERVAASSEAEPHGTSTAALTFEGSGNTALEPFNLAAGVYAFSATCDEGIFFLDVTPVGGDEFMRLDLDDVEGSTNVLLEGGRYVVSLTCQGNWSVAIDLLAANAVGQLVVIEQVTGSGVDRRRQSS
jgi:hypothetical protein